jgi:hypothetical protein
MYERFVTARLQKKIEAIMFRAVFWVILPCRMIVILEEQSGFRKGRSGADNSLF